MKSTVPVILLCFIPAFILFSILTPVHVNAQQKLPDSLQIAFREAKNDSIKFKVSRAIYTFYEETNRDSALHFARLRYAIVRKYNRKIEEAFLLGQMAYQQIYLGQFSAALTNLTEALQIASMAKDAETWELSAYSTPGMSRQITLSMLNHMYGHLKMQTGSPESLHYLKEGRRIGKEIGNHFRVTVGAMVIATNYLLLNQPDSALAYAKEGEEYGIRGGIPKYLPYIWFCMGEIYRHKGLDSLALTYYHGSRQYARKEGNIMVLANANASLHRYFQLKNNSDSALFYASENLDVVKSVGAVTSFVASDINLGNAYYHLAMAYTLKRNSDSTNKYLQLALSAKDSLIAIKLKSLATFQRLTLDEQLRLQNEEKQRIETDTKRKMYILFGSIAVAFIIIMLIFRNNRQKQKAYNLLQIQKAETDLQKEKADNALQELKSAQSQLIQSEKMASLGELTAGIAHEIQNPLNFVNNFSEVNLELVHELKEELTKGNTEEAISIATIIANNESKIGFHGKRADAIVKGMLQHSQSASGKPEPTNINALADEYLRLAYHGLRAKNKSFNATLLTKFDPAIHTINVVPQDISRVLLNIYNNAFYAVSEKSKQQINGYEPIVELITFAIKNNIEIRVRDNGMGIPEKVAGKIFQPFFTTKPTGQGTGLGLSLSYDIVKAHGGELTVETKEGEGSTFCIQLPLN